MRLTTFSDYALRVMLFASMKQEQRFTIDEMNAALGISRTHLTKVVNALTKAQYLGSKRGRNGGLRLEKPAKSIRLGALITATENDFNMVECMREHGQCNLKAGCKLPPILSAATQAFVAVLDQYTLSDIAMQPDIFQNLTIQSQSEARI